MIAFSNHTAPSAEAISTAWTELFPNQPALQPDAEPRPEGSPIAFTTGTTSLMFAHVDTPIPWPEVETACQVSWMWPDAASSLKSHRSHAICVCLPGGQNTTPIDAAACALAVSRLIAAAMHAGKPAGVYWGNAGLCHKPEDFIDAVRTADEEGIHPAMLWVGVLISARGPQGPFTLTTHGLRSLGQKEFEIIDTRMPAGDLRMLAIDLAIYVLDAGPVLLDGQTFGRSAEERMRIEHTGSRFRRGEDIIRLHLP